MEEIQGELKESSEEIEQRKNTIKKKFSSWIKDNYDKVFLFILFVSFIIEILIFVKTLHQPLWYDEASYMATAQRLGLGLNVNDVWYYRRGFLWPLISTPLYFLGIGEIGVRFLVVLFSLGITAVSYFLIKEMFNKKIALFVSVSISLSWIVLFYSGRVLTDIPSAFFIILSVLFFWKGYVSKKGNKYLYFFGAFYAIAVMVRMQNLMFAPTFLIFMLVKDKFKFFKDKHFWITVGIFALIFIPQIILYYTHYGNPLTDILAHYLGVNAGGTTTVNPLTGNNIFEYFIDLPKILGGENSFGKVTFFLFLIGLFYFFADMILGFDKIFKDSEVQKRFFILLWIVIPLLVLGYMSPDYPDERYIIPVLMFLFLIVWYPLEKAQKFLTKKSKITEKSTYILAFLLIIILLVPNLLWGFQLTDSKKTSYAEVAEAGIWLNKNSNISDIVITPSQPQILYYSQRSTYTQGASETEFKDLINKLKPNYLVMSVYEQNPGWLVNYTAQKNSNLVPVQVYQQNNQPILIIYKMNS